MAFSGGKDELIAAIKVKLADVLAPGGDTLYLQMSSLALEWEPFF